MHKYRTETETEHPYIPDYSNISALTILSLISKIPCLPRRYGISASLSSVSVDISNIPYLVTTILLEIYALLLLLTFNFVTASF